MAQLPARGPRTVVKQGDIYFVNYEPTMGREQSGRRPSLVISPEAFNRCTNAPIVLPVTNGGAFARRIGFAVPLPPSLITTGVVRCDQPRVLDLSERGARFVEAVPAETLEEVLQRFLSVFDPEIA